MILRLITPLPHTVFTVENFIDGLRRISYRFIADSIKFTKTLVYLTNMIRVSVRIDRSNYCHRLACSFYNEALTSVVRAVQ